MQGSASAGAARIGHQQASRLLLSKHDVLLSAELALLHFPVSPVDGTLASNQRRPRGQGQRGNAFCQGRRWGFLPMLEFVASLKRSLLCSIKREIIALQIYKGAVLFIDILGVGALTKSKKDDVTVEDFAAFGSTRTEDLRNQVFCAVLLSRFRRNLRSCRMRNVRIAQLSDCAFVWSKHPDGIVEFARMIFWKNLKSGLLCRAGLTYGEIVEPDKIGVKIGDFVCGEAVSRAVELEEIGKGARIFIDREIGGRVFKNTPSSAFVPVSSAIDFRTVDEYLWYALPPDGNVATGAPREHLINIIDASLRLRFEPSFRWNAASPPGRIHVGATIERLETAALELCAKHKITPPDFPFLKCETYMEMGTQGNDSDRNPRVYAALRKHASIYKQRVFPKSRKKPSR